MDGGKYPRSSHKPRGPHPVKRAVIYARYSSHNQRDVSIADQIAACTRYIEERGWELVGVYVDEALSGRSTGRRKDFQRLMDDVPGGDWDVLVMWHTDRVNRSTRNALITLARLMMCDKTFASVQQAELQFDDRDDGFKYVLYVIYAWKDEQVSRDIGANVRRGLLGNAERCHPNGVRRYGYDIVGARIDGHGRYHPGDRYEVNEAEAEAVRDMCRLRREGMSWERVAVAVRGLGHRAKDGGELTAVMCRRAACDPAIMGTYHYGGVVVPGGMPAIVGAGEYEAVLAATCRRSRRRRRKAGPRKRRERPAPGSLYGDLEVVAPYPNKGIHGRWECRCRACGGSKVEYTTRLTQGLATHCGCLSASGRERDALGRFV